MELGGDVDRSVVLMDLAFLESDVKMVEEGSDVELVQMGIVGMVLVRVVIVWDVMMVSASEVLPVRIHRWVLSVVHAHLDIEEMGQGMAAGGLDVLKILVSEE